MAFEYIDLENKLYIPTQSLSSEVQANLISLYAYIRQTLLEAHNTLAMLGKEWYDNPLETSTRWYAVCQLLHKSVYQSGRRAAAKG